MKGSTVRVKGTSREGVVEEWLTRVVFMNPDGTMFHEIISPAALDVIIERKLDPRRKNKNKYARFGTMYCSCNEALERFGENEWRCPECYDKGVSNEQEEYKGAYCPGCKKPIHTTESWGCKCD